MEQKYTDPIIQKYFDLIRAGNREIRQYYQGDPIKIPDSLLPCLIIEKNETGARNSTNMEDEHAVALRLTLVTSIRRELSTQEEINKIMPGIASLYDIMEGRESDFTLKPSSILDIIRKNALVDVQNGLRTDLDTITRIDYGETLRQRDPAEWSVEARMDIVAHFRQIR